ncbi:MAG: hypothetical protein JNK61_05395 [Bacteroidia bacterium]|nr:hypothetical protein [Bacteroidia bacterium]
MKSQSYYLVDKFILHVRIPNNICNGNNASQYLCGRGWLIMCYGEEQIFLFIVRVIDKLMNDV